MSIAGPDISIVLNLHREAKYLKRTMLSMVEAVQFSALSGTIFELVIVLDNADGPTSDVADNMVHRYAHWFQDVKVINVQNASLGPSRNDGIAASSGTYISLADGDDLISYNFYDSCLEAAITNGSMAIVVPEFILAFGSKTHFWQYFPSSNSSLLAFFGENAYTSKLFCHRSIFQSLNYLDARGGRKAFEDWHFNVSSLVFGYKFICAKNAILFYRQRYGSIMAAGGHRIIPPSPFFSPKNFVSICQETYSQIDRQGDYLGLTSDQLRRTWKETHVLHELIRAANRIDTAVELRPVEWTWLGTNRNLYYETRCGAAYYEACVEVNAESYTDVLILPDLGIGGAHKYILDVIRVIEESDPNFRLLVLSGQHEGPHAWRSRLPSRTDFVDLHSIALKWDCIGQIPLLALRLIQSVCVNARIHLKSSQFMEDLLDRYVTEFPPSKIVFYYFCDNAYRESGIRWVSGNNFDFLSEHSQHLDFIISDHNGILDDTSLRLDLSNVRHRALYAPIETTRYKRRDLNKRVLWASRIDSQKRPSLVCAIAKNLLLADPDWTIDVYGDGPGYEELEECASQVPNLFLKGSYDGFDSIAEDYSVLLYTSEFDGIPNVIIEAMAEGMMVIAPDIGGIGELLAEGGGLLISDDVDDEVLALSYKKALLKLHETPSKFESYLENSLKRLQDFHSMEFFRSSVRQLFGFQSK